MGRITSRGSRRYAWFKSKHKLGFIDGTIQRPKTGDPKEEQWEAVNGVITGWLFNSISKELMSTVSRTDDAKALWDELKRRFSQGNRTRRYRLKSEINSTRQEGRAVEEYYSVMKALWDELDNYTEIPSCEHCDAAAKCVDQRDSDRSLEFLMGLNSDTFGTLRWNILSMNPEPDLDKIYSLVIQEQQHRQISHGHEQTAAAYAARNFSGPNPGMIRLKGLKNNKTSYGSSMNCL